NRYANRVMFAEYRDVAADCAKAARVAAAVIGKISPEAYELVYYACLSCDEERGNAVLQFIRKGIRLGAAVVDDLRDYNVMKVFELKRNAFREMEHYRGFLRFVQQGDCLLARFEPRNNLLVPIAEFFCDRLRQENYAIVDMARGKAAVCRANEPFYLCDVDADKVRNIEYEDAERALDGLWRTFESAIGIEARYNPGLQRQNMPLRFRKYMNADEGGGVRGTSHEAAKRRR
ncbi:MAG: TIGR03915 family putative DNA repair protein, partial [Butyrivibrio sp.]|nr:TIGR03915 family putative DNA repair protein [Butyrivibrio sp.]